jgi:hypothetical protein
LQLSKRSTYWGFSKYGQLPSSSAQGKDTPGSNSQNPLTVSPLRCFRNWLKNTIWSSFLQSWKGSKTKTLSKTQQSSSTTTETSSGNRRRVTFPGWEISTSQPTTWKDKLDIPSLKQSLERSESISAMAGIIHSTGSALDSMGQK